MEQTMEQLSVKIEQSGEMSIEELALLLFVADAVSKDIRSNKGEFNSGKSKYNCKSKN